MKMRRLTYAALKCRRRRRLGRCSFITFFVACHIFQRVLIHPLQGDARRRFRLFFHDGDNRLTDEPKSRGNRSSETHIRQREVSLLRNITPPDNFWLSPTMTEFITIIEPLSFYIPPPRLCVYVHTFIRCRASISIRQWPIEEKRKRKKIRKNLLRFFSCIDGCTTHNIPRWLELPMPNFQSRIRPNICLSLSFFSFLIRRCYTVRSLGPTIQKSRSVQLDRLLWIIRRVHSSVCRAYTLYRSGEEAVFCIKDSQWGRQRNRTLSVVSITQDGNRNAKKNRKEVGAHTFRLSVIVYSHSTWIYISRPMIVYPQCCVLYYQPFYARIYSTEMMMKGKMWFSRS